jgi:gas vesicle protein
MDMSETYGSAQTQDDDTTRELGTVETSSASDAYGTDSHGTDSPIGTSDFGATPGSSDTREVAKDEVRATADQAKEGARHVAEVGKGEAKNVAQETSQQAKELWQQTRNQLMDQSAHQQTKVAEGLRSLSQELSSMARGSDQQGVASDLAQQASQRIGDVAGWLDQRDPGSLVSEVRQFARQRPGTFLATAALVGLVGGRLSRGLVADHQDRSDTAGPAGGGATAAPSPVDHSTAGYSAYGAGSGSSTATGSHPVSDTLSEAGGFHGRSGPISGGGADAGEVPR